MEEREGTNNNNISISSSFGLKQQHEGPPGIPYHLDTQPRSENPNPFPVGFASSATAAKVTESAAAAAPAFSLTMPVENSSSELKKKRGRPRKYNPDGSLAVTLSPMPISSSVPLKRGRGRGRGRERGGRAQQAQLGRGESSSINNNWLKNPQMFQVDNNNPPSGGGGGGGSGHVASASFTPHVLTVNAGEDVTMKIMTFSQQGNRSICILSANGSISNVTLRQSTTSGATLTYEGHFEILSLTGSFTPSESGGGARSRAGGMSVSLAGPDGRVFGGGLAGLFIAAGPVQVMVGSFIAGQEEPQQQQQQQIMKQRRERLSVPTTTQTSNISFGGSAEDPKARFGLNKPVVIQAPHVSAPPVSFPNEPSTNPVQGYYANSTANHIKDLFSSFPGDDDDDVDGDEDEEFRGHSESDTEIPN